MSKYYCNGKKGFCRRPLENKFCGKCEFADGSGGYEVKCVTHYDEITNMSVDELAQFICGIYDYEYDSPVYDEIENGKHICGDFIPDYDEDKIKQWLETEVDAN